MRQSKTGGTILLTDATEVGLEACCKVIVMNADLTAPDDTRLLRALPCIISYNLTMSLVIERLTGHSFRLKKPVMARREN